MNFLFFIRKAQDKLQSPLQVLMCLAIENGPLLSSVRDYFLQVFQKDNESAQKVGTFFPMKLFWNLN